MILIKDTLLVLFFIVLTTTSGISQDCKLKLGGFNQDSNVAYIGVSNSIKSEAGLLELRTNNGKIIIENERYFYRPNLIGQAEIVSISKNIEGIVPKADTCEITIKYLPFTFEIGYKTTFFKSTIQVEKKSLIKEIFYVRSTNTNLNANAKILGFDLLIKRKGNKIIEKTYSDYEKPNRSEISNLFESLELNDIVVIDKLKYTYLQDVVIEHKQIRIVVK